MPGVGAGSVWRAWWGTIASPRASSRQVDRDGLNGGSFVVYALFPAFYGVSTFVAHLHGARPNWQPWVSVIPTESYYLWEALFLVPLCLQLWVLLAAVAHLLARWQGGQGSFERTLAVFAYTYSVPLVVSMWLPDLLQLLVVGVKPRMGLVAVYGTLAGIWTVLLCALGLRIVHGLSYTRSLLTVAAAIVLSYAPAGLLLIR